LHLWLRSIAAYSSPLHHLDTLSPPPLSETLSPPC
jgi:hypothetical protein